MKRAGMGAVLVLAALAMVQCEWGHSGARARVGHEGTGSAFAEMDQGELDDLLTDLAHAHEQKQGVATWVSLPVVGKSVGPAFKGFYAEMGKKQGELHKEIMEWAKGHGMDLTYSYPDSADGRALKVMEDRQEKLLKADGQQDFERDMLIQMYSDYEWQISELQVLLPRVKDKDLKGYVEKSLKVHEEGSAEIMGLLRRFKFAG